ncbi:hypothetical protein ACQ4PT_031520 [Festuca glaucescens]
MDKFLVAAPPCAGEDPEAPPPPPRRWHRWSRIAVELDGRIDARFRHRELRRLLDSYAETRTFEHKYYTHGEQRCQTYVNRMINASNFAGCYHPAREGVSAMEFDKKGVYLASVTLSGCLTVHDFETLYCSLYGPSCTCLMQIVCSSSQSDKVSLFDIGYVSSVPAEVLQKGKTKFHALCSESRKGLTDLAFTSDDKSRLFASGLDGAVYMWDRRLSKTHCIELTALPESQFTSVKLNMDNRTVFGATRNGTIHAWDTRGGRASAAFQSHNEVQPLSSVKISTLLGKIASLKEQSNIVSSEIMSIDFNPSCSYQLAFHLDDGWSGVLNVNTLSVSHLHCPPPSWLEGVDSVLHKRKATWLSTSSIYAVGSSSNNGMYVLDFHPHTSSACHVDYNAETKGFEENQPAENKFIPLSEGVLSCAAHPLSHNIIAGTEFSSLLMVSQKHETIRDPE